MKIVKIYSIESVKGIRVTLRPSLLIKIRIKITLSLVQCLSTTLNRLRCVGLDAEFRGPVHETDRVDDGRTRFTPPVSKTGPRGRDRVRDGVGGWGS